VHVYQRSACPNEGATTGRSITRSEGCLEVGKASGALCPTVGVGWLLQPFGQHPEMLKMWNQFLTWGGERVHACDRGSWIDSPFDQAGVLEFSQPLDDDASSRGHGSRQLIEPYRPLSELNQDPCRPPLAEQQLEGGWPIVAWAGA
jgi:hypothetical protein